MNFGYKELALALTLKSLYELWDYFVFKWEVPKNNWHKTQKKLEADASSVETDN